MVLPFWAGLSSGKAPTVCTEKPCTHVHAALSVLTKKIQSNLNARSSNRPHQEGGTITHMSLLSMIWKAFEQNEFEKKMAKQSALYKLIIRNINKTETLLTCAYLFGM